MAKKPMQEKLVIQYREPWNNEVRYWTKGNPGDMFEIIPLIEWDNFKARLNSLGIVTELYLDED